MDDSTKNRHPADELADVRDEIARLEWREAELRNVLLADGADRLGVEWEAAIRHGTNERIDVKSAIKHFGSAAVEPFLRRTDFCAVRLKRR